MTTSVVRADSLTATPCGRAALQVRKREKAMPGDSSKRKRARQPMPDFVRRALDDRGLGDAYDARPPYQRNDYLLWINNARRKETKESRLRQMLDELELGGVYMNMEHPASKKQ